jgi:hypothetical protein
LGFLEFVGYLALLVVAHFAGDFFLQILLQKILILLKIRYTKSFWQLQLHCLLYLVPFVPVFWFLKIDWVLLFPLFITHVLVDGGLMKDLKARNKRANMSYIKRLMTLDPVLVLDQGLYLSVIFTIFIVWWCSGGLS